MGNHEILKRDSIRIRRKAETDLRGSERDEGQAARQATPTHDGRCSLIELLRTQHREAPQPMLQLMYGQ